MLAKPTNQQASPTNDAAQMYSPSRRGRLSGCVLLTTLISLLITHSHNLFPFFPYTPFVESTPPSRQLSTVTRTMRHSSTSPRTSNMQRVSSCCLPSLCGAARGCNPIHPIQTLDVASSRARRPCFTHSQHHTFLSLFLRHSPACLAVQCLLKPPFGRRVGACSRMSSDPNHLVWGIRAAQPERKRRINAYGLVTCLKLNVTVNRNRQWRRLGSGPPPYRSSHFPRDSVPYRPYHANRTNIVVHSMSTPMRPVCVPKRLFSTLPRTASI